MRGESTRFLGEAVFLRGEATNLGGAGWRLVSWRREAGGDRRGIAVRVVANRRRQGKGHLHSTRKVRLALGAAIDLLLRKICEAY